MDTSEQKNEPKKNILERKNRSLSNMAEFITSSPLLAKRYRNGSLINNDHCEACGEGGSLLCCEDCPKSFHFVCLDPPITEVPEEAWFCRSCFTKKNPPQKKQTPLSSLIYQIDCSNSDTFYLPSSLINEITVEGEQIPSPSSKVRTTKKKRQHDEYCFVCNINSGQFLDCSKCKKSFHLYCLDPPLLRMPTGKWVCSDHKDKKSILSSIDIKKNFIVPQVIVPLKFLPTVQSQVTVKNKRKSTPIRSDNEDKQVAVELLNDMYKVATKEEQKIQNNGDFSELNNQTFHALKRFVTDAINITQKEREERKFWENLSVAGTVESIPDFNKLSNATIDELSNMNPLFVQFLAWQRLVHLNTEKKNNKDTPISQTIYKNIDSSPGNVMGNNLSGKSGELQRLKNFIDRDKKGMGSRKSERIGKTKKTVAPPPSNILEESNKSSSSQQLVDLVDNNNGSGNFNNNVPVINLNNPQNNNAPYPPSNNAPLLPPLSSNVIVSLLPNSPNSNSIPNSTNASVYLPNPTFPPINSKKRNLNNENGNGTNGGNANKVAKKKKDNIICRLEMKDSDEYFYDMTEGEKFFIVGRVPSSSVGETQKEIVHIDLKNYKHAKMISRKHLKISYNPEKKKFFVHVMGRNGVLFSGVRYAKGDNIEVKKKQSTIKIGRADFILTTFI